MLRTDRRHKRRSYSAPFHSRRTTFSKTPLSNQTRAEHPSSDRDRGASVGLLHRIALSSSALRHKHWLWHPATLHSPAPAIQIVTFLWRCTTADMVTAKARMCDKVTAAPLLIFRRAVVTLKTIRFKAKNVTFCPHSAFMCFVCV